MSVKKWRNVEISPGVFAMKCDRPSRLLCRVRIVAMLAGALLGFATVAAVVIFLAGFVCEAYGSDMYDHGYQAGLHAGTKVKPKAVRVDTLVLWQPLAVPRASDSNYCDSLFKEKK
jgi:hypothetical protein